MQMWRQPTPTPRCHSRVTHTACHVLLESDEWAKCKYQENIFACRRCCLLCANLLPVTSHFTSAQLDMLHCLARRRVNHRGPCRLRVLYVPDTHFLCSRHKWDKRNCLRSISSSHILTPGRFVTNHVNTVSVQLPVVNRARHCKKDVSNEGTMNYGSTPTELGVCLFVFLVRARPP